ncbi:GNAT family N-acetyltransferase [Streptomyces sp. NPDC046915]|uniref:GNAT family N-acetyltransferase n=1 Tax=Streptomyces sp. NPDC046915 TaxID=3155257 RepID=UPI0033CCDF1B
MRAYEPRPVALATRSGGRTKGNRIATGLDKTHTIDALCVGLLDHEHGDAVVRFPEGYARRRGLRIEAVGSELALEQWRHVHNVIVPPAAMPLEDARERLGRNRLVNAYVGDVLVGNSTVRPPRDEDGVATVIARVLPEFRGRGYGRALYEDGFAHARVLGARGVETCVLAVNEHGLRFAEKCGFVEVERYVLDGESDEWTDLGLGTLTVSG